ncbi:MAG: helix-turn-helix transcriptional regulator [Clostridia bacterium]|nr:helix-turn-helix transcriptional regulator [Clostridia bacterium]
MLRYKIDVLAALKAAGYTTYKLEHEKLLHKMTVQKLRHNELVSWAVIDDLCRLLNMQPGDLVEYIPNEAKE